MHIFKSSQVLNSQTLKSSQILKPESPTGQDLDLRCVDNCPSRWRPDSVAVRCVWTDVVVFVVLQVALLFDSETIKHTQ